jgi:hypothetical protein
MCEDNDPDFHSEDLALLEELIPEAMGSPECIPTKPARDVKLKAAVMLLPSE